jgi:Kef-type K+ transport system membrane component KefB
MRFMIIVRASRAIIPYLLERWLGLNGDTARRIGHVLSQGGEFAFVLFAMGVIQSMIGEPLVHLIKLAVTLSMAAQSLALFLSTKPSPVPQRQSHLNHIAVGGLKRLAGHKELKWRCP